MKNKKNVPEIRFKGFAEEWKEQRLGEIANNFYGGGTPRTTIDSYWNGHIPWIQTSDLKEGQVFGVVPQKYISDSGVKESATKLVPENSIAIITRVGVGKLSLIPFKYATSQDFLSISKLKIDGNFATYAIHRKMQAVLKEVQGTSIKGVTKEELLAKEIEIPTDKCEQKAIGNYFQNIDRLINTSQTKLDKLKNIKKACLEKMFPRNGSTTPELRFKGFTEEWEHIYLKDTGNWDKGYGLPKADLDKEGLYPCIHYGELFAYSEIIKSVISYTNIKSDKITSNNDILFPDSDVTPDGLGRCSAIEIPNVILGGGINVLKLYKDFKAPYISLNINNNRKQIIERVTGTTVRHIHSKDLNDIELFVSENLIEQQKIGDYFEKLDILIAKTEQQINKLKNIKKACLDKMFVNAER